ncbi:hypothetical protein OAU28_01480 [Flavobacteriales bacterium]|nr:hypothetical protein [Flavobacteriales bacterium]
MAIQEKLTLKNYFRQGDIPTEENFTDLIDSVFTITGSTTGNIDLIGNITASGTISASGTINASNFHVPGDGRISFDDEETDDQFIKGLDNNITINGHNFIHLDAANSVTVRTSGMMVNDTTAPTSTLQVAGDIWSSGSNGHITTSGDISASGDLYANKYHSLGYNLLRYKTNEDRVIVGSKFKTTHITGSSLTLGDGPGFHITASGNISASSFIGDGSSLTSLPSQTDNNFTTTLKNKLDAIEASADVTDTANVTAAGALMDSELTSISSIKSINQGLTTTSVVTFAGIGLTKTGISAGNFGEAIATEGQSFKITINNIPTIPGTASGTIFKTVNNAITNDSITEASVILISSTRELSAVAFRIAAGSCLFSISNESVSDFSAGSASFNFTIF